MMRMQRRRFLTILAGSSLVLAADGSASPLTAPLQWRGTALGAEASLTLYHPDRRQGTAIMDDCVAELRRLEGILSLYDPGSALSVLNRAGRLDQAPPELTALLAESIAYGQLSGGAFDVTVQPLWRLYADHFAANPNGATGPAAERMAQARRLVNFRSIRVDGQRVSLAPGQAVTLNGIAQGWITDRIAERLKALGLTHVLLDLGESRALGGHTDGRPWRLGIPDPRAPDRLLTRFELSQQAAATSGGYGMAFDPAGHFNHILDPASGDSARVWASVTVIADTATKADALSTVLSVAPRSHAAGLLAKAGNASAIMIDDAGEMRRL
ncbi:MAG: FAD:protein FMN transferase [Rhodospirillaceae bacterium]|nr:FAD:protein FMN transferase [Rhodospirillales bacterium]